MAGMLPGVECARRRRLRQKTEWAESPFMAASGSSRKSSFCLYRSNNEISPLSISPLMRSVEKEAEEDEKLDERVRVAKERLDGRLRAKSKPEAGNNGGWRWKKMLEQEECAICL